MLISLSDSELISKIFLFIAYSNSLSVFPTPEKTIFFGLMPALIANINSPLETTSAPSPKFFISLIKFKFVLDLIAKQTRGENLPNFELKFWIFFFIFSYE